MAYAKIKRIKYMHNINNNAVQGRLSENYLAWNILDNIRNLRWLKTGGAHMHCPRLKSDQRTTHIIENYLSQDQLELCRAHTPRAHYAINRFTFGAWL